MSLKVTILMVILMVTHYHKKRIHLARKSEKAMTLQYSCLENPRDRGAWWAAVYGVAQSRTRLKRLSSQEIGT